MPNEILDTVIVLAGGQGTRLKPMTEFIPKPLVRVANMPMLEHVLFGLQQGGITRAAMAVGPQLGALEGHFGTGSGLGLDISYFVEHQPLGSGGAILNVREQKPQLLAGTFLIANADVLHNVDIQAAMHFHREKQSLATLICAPVPNPHEFGVCEFDESGRISGFYEKPAPGVTPSNWVNLGLWIWEPQLLDRIGAGFTMAEDDLFPMMLREGLPMFAFRHPGYWLDAGTPERYLRAQRDALAGKFPHDLSRAGQIVPENSLLGIEADAKGAILRDCVLGERAVVQPSAKLGNCVLYPDTFVGAGATLTNCVLGPGVRVEGELHDEIRFDRAPLS